MTEDNVVNICLCPSCQSMTTMKQIVEDTFFCKLCKEQFKQFKNGKLIYVPLAVSETVEKFKKQLEEMQEDNDQTDLDFDIEFEPEFDPED